MRWHYCCNLAQAEKESVARINAYSSKTMIRYQPLTEWTIFDRCDVWPDKGHCAWALLLASWRRELLVVLQHLWSPGSQKQSAHGEWLDHHPVRSEADARGLWRPQRRRIERKFPRLFADEAHSTDTKYQTLDPAGCDSRAAAVSYATHPGSSSQAGDHHSHTESWVSWQLFVETVMAERGGLRLENFGFASFASFAKVILEHPTFSTTRSTNYHVTKTNIMLCTMHPTSNTHHQANANIRKGVHHVSCATAITTLCLPTLPRV